MARDKDSKKKKRDDSFIEHMIFQIMQKSMKQALDSALDEIIDGFK